MEARPALLPPLPPMATVRQVFQAHALPDVPAAVTHEMARLGLGTLIRPGQQVAVTAGSRGITDMPAVLVRVIQELRGLGAQPYIVPAMGSHGGATAEGQAALLAGYGLTAERLGVPLRAAMDVVEIGCTPRGLPVLMGREAFTADHLVVVNRVKPHTDFEAPVESGLLKMLTVGLGKQRGAEQFHNAVLHHGYYDTLMEMARVALARGPVTFGLGLVENQREETAIVRGALRAGIADLDRELLVEAKRLLPRLPFRAIDLLVVDWMGKDVSGTGMDQNVIARTVIKVGTAPATPSIRRIFVRDLTAKSQGMATGIGNADFTTRRLVEKIDRPATYMNCLTACEPEMAAIPPYYDTDAEAIGQALKTIGLTPPAEARVVRIADTLHLETLQVSAPLLEEARQQPGLEILSEPQPWRFDALGDLLPLG